MNEQHAAMASQAASLVLGPAIVEAEEPPASALAQDAEPTESEPPSSSAPLPGPVSETLKTKNAPRSSNCTSGVRHPFWKDVPDALWEDWRWQRQHAVRSATELAGLLALPPEEVAALELLEAKYRTAIPPYYFSLIDTANPVDPIRLQSVPTSQEDSNESTIELDDPLEEDKDSPVPGVTHRYPDRALLITTPVCSMYCRFCTRKRVTMDRDGWDAPSRDEERMVEYVRNTPAIRDVIVSGGDPLTLPVAKLRWFVTELAAIEHVDVIRIGTRVPVTLPQRLFDPELIDLLAEAGKIWIQTHFNHPVEITPEAARACRNLIAAGMPVNNHTVLMKGVNDSVETMRQLIRALLRIKVRPYYLFHCDPVTGAGHFRTSVWKGIEIMEGLRGHISGLGIPTYVIDGVHGAGKIPVMPNYLLSASDDAVVLRNYEGMIFRYAPDDTSSGAQPIESQGVSRVLSGNGKPLVPQDTPRINRRKKIAADKVAAVKVTADKVAAVAAELNQIDVVMPPLRQSTSARSASTAAKGPNGKAKPQSTVKAANGAAAANGAVANGSATNGTVANGAVANGAGTNGSGTNGSAANVRANGHANGKSAGKANATNGTSSNGTTGHTNGHGAYKSNGAANGKSVASRTDRAQSMHELLRRPARPMENGAERMSAPKANKKDQFSSDCTPLRTA